MNIAAFGWGLFAILLTCSVAGAQEVTTSPQSAPIIAVLTAAKASDVEGFKNSYSKTIQDDKTRDWKQHLAQAHDEMQKKFGDYRIVDFTFKFVGDGERGDVTIFHLGKNALLLEVVREGDEWKVGKP